MHKRIQEDWAFTITVLDGGLCRMGFEAGDAFGFCWWQGI